MESISPAVAPGDLETPSIWLPRSSDELLARHAARGSERAFAVLFERYHQRLYRYCRSIVRNEADAQDALQSTFASALSALKRGQRNAPLRPWLFRIAHNEAIGVIRKRTRDSSQELGHAAHQTTSSAEEEAAERARWAGLVADLAQLPDRSRSALLLRELNGLSHEEIAVVLGTTLGGAKQAIFEARQALFELSEGRAMKCEEIRRRISAGDRRMLRGRAVRAHLSDCSACERFADSIRARTHELRAYVPVLAPAASAALLQRALHASVGHGHAVAGSSAATATGGSAAGGSLTTSTAAAGVAGKAAAAAVTSKVIAAAAVVATAGVGVVGVRTLVAPDSGATRAAAHSARAGHAISAPTGARQAGHGASAPGHKRAGLGKARSQNASAGSNRGGDSAASSRHASHSRGSSRGSSSVSRRSSRSRSSSHGRATRSRGSSAAGQSKTTGTPGQTGGLTHHTANASSRPVHSSGSVSVAGVSVPLPTGGGHAIKVPGK